MKICANYFLKQLIAGWYNVILIARSYSQRSVSPADKKVASHRHPELKKFAHHNAFSSLLEAIEYHETALNEGKFVKGFFTSDKKTLEAVSSMFDESPYQQFLTELLLTPPSLSTNEQRTRIITFSPIENFPEHLPKYVKHKAQTSLLSVGGPAALDTAVLGSLIPDIKLAHNIHICGPFKESNLAHSAFQLHVRHGTALNAERELTGHILLVPFLIRHFRGCTIEEILHPDFRKIDLKFSSINAEKLRIYLGNEYNWFKQAIRHQLGLMTEHDLNRLESAFSQDVLRLIENVSGMALSSKAGRDPAKSISIHVDLTETGKEETHANNILIKKTVGIESVPLTNDEKDFFFGPQKVNIVEATRYPNDGSLLLQTQPLKQKILMDRGGQCLQQHITHILFAENENITGKARLAGVITEDGQFIYGSHLHLSPGYKAKFEFGKPKRSSFYRNLLNRMENKMNISRPVPGHRLTVATGTSLTVLMQNSPHLKKIIATYGTTPQFAVTNSHWTLLAKNETHILMRITGGGNTGLEDYNPAYFFNLVANTGRIFGREALVGIIATYGCPRSINARNSTECFKAANVLISYGKGGTGNTKRHAEAVLALLELGFIDNMMTFLKQNSNYAEKSLTETVNFIHEKAKNMKFLRHDDMHFDRRLGYNSQLSHREKVSVAVFFVGLIILINTAVFMDKESIVDMNNSQSS